MDARRLRWLAVIVPVIAIGVLDLVTDHELSDLITAPLNTLAVPVIGLVVALVFANVAFDRIDRLTGTVRERNTALERRNASLEALGEISAAVATERPLEEIFETILARARALIAADVATITVRDADASPGTAAVSGDAAAPAPRTSRSAPLRRGDAVIGELTVGWSAAGVEIDRDANELLASLANEAAAAVERDRLRRELRELAIRGERERIAREMHDGLAQVLGYVNTKALAVEELLAADRPHDARRQLAELSAAARSVYVDVREAILGLTSPIQVGDGVVAAIESYAGRFADASKIAVRVNATPGARAARLRPETEGEVFRIVREALTNVRKHASAHRVALDLSTESGCLTVRVADDGTGLAATKAAAADWPHYGMQMMRERATAIEAAATWSNAPGGGTVFDLRVPLTASESVTA